MNRFRNVQDQAADQVKDAVIDGKYDIKDAETKRDEFGMKIRTAKADIIMQEKEANASRESIAKMTLAAKSAADQGQLEDVTRIVGEKQKEEATLKKLELQIAKNRKLINAAQGQIDVLDNQISTAKADYSGLVIQKESADIHKSLAEGMAGLSGSSAFSRLNDLKRAADRADAEAQAAEESMPASAKVDDLVDKYTAGAGTQSVNDEVAALMAAAKKPS